MPKTKALFLLWIFVGANLQLYQLLKIPYFIQHFYTHQNLNLAEFIHAHYHDHNHTDEHHHDTPFIHTHSYQNAHEHAPPLTPHSHPAQEQKLPFAKIDNLSSFFIKTSTQSTFFAIVSSVFLFITRRSPIVKDTFCSPALWFCLGYKLALFRPPR